MVTTKISILITDILMKKLFKEQINTRKKKIKKVYEIKTWIFLFYFFIILKNVLCYIFYKYKFIQKKKQLTEIAIFLQDWN